VVAAGLDPGAPGVDTDHDGLSDAYEASLGSDPHAADTDHDGINDGIEAAHHTSVIDGDSDHDGLGDLYEMTHDGMDPLHAMPLQDDPFAGADHVSGMTDDADHNDFMHSFADHTVNDHDGDITDPDNDHHGVHAA
jgi:hypothetical protein